MAGLRALIASLLVASLAGAAPARADDVLATEHSTVANLDAHAGTVVWSVLDPDTQLWSLRGRVGGSVVTLPVRPRGAPFDVDLGPDARGRTVAVYSRCPVEEREVASDGCDVRVLDPRTLRERRLRGASRRGWSESRPAIWRGRLAFARFRDGARRLRDALPRIVLLDMRTGRERRLAGGTRGLWRMRAPGDWDGGGPLALDLRGRTVAFTWRAAVAECGAREAPDGASMERDELRVVAPGRRARQLDYACASPEDIVPARLGAPSLGARDLAFTTPNDDAAVTVSSLDGRARFGATFDLSPLEVVRDGSRFLYLGSGRRGTTRVLRADPVTLEPNPR